MGVLDRIAKIATKASSDAGNLARKGATSLADTAATQIEQGKGILGRIQNPMQLRNAGLGPNKVVRTRSQPIVNWKSTEPGIFHNPVDSELRTPVLRPDQYGRETSPTPHPVKQWVDSVLGKYYTRDIGTAEDPILQLLRAGEPIHKEMTGWAPVHRLPSIETEPNGLAAEWAAESDNMLTRRSPRELKRLFANRGRHIPKWLAFAEDKPMLVLDEGDNTDLGFQHIVDYLNNQLNTGQLRPEQLSKVSLKQAVQGTAKWNKQLAKQKEVEGLKAIRGVYKEYPEGYKWVEVAPEGLAAEGAAMKHCVGGYCDDVESGYTKIYSLRDPSGKPVTTVEIDTRPGFSGDVLMRDDDLNSTGYDAWRGFLDREDRNLALPEYLKKHHPKVYERHAAPKILQIKSPANGAPKPEYLKYVQDFVRSGKWGSVEDLKNAGMYNAPGKFWDASQANRSKVVPYNVGANGQPLPMIPEGYYTEEDLANMFTPKQNIPSRDTGPEEFAEGGFVRTNAGNPRQVRNAEVVEPLTQLPKMFAGAARGAVKTAVTWPGELERIALDLAYKRDNDTPVENTELHEVQGPLRIRAPSTGVLSKNVLSDDVINAYGNIPNSTERWRSGHGSTKTWLPTGEDFDRVLPATPKIQNTGYGAAVNPYEQIGEAFMLSPQQVGRGAKTLLDATRMELGKVLPQRTVATTALAHRAAPIARPSTRAVGVDTSTTAHTVMPVVGLPFVSEGATQKFAKGGLVVPQDLTAKLEDMYKLPTGLLAAVAKVESNNDPEAVSPKGAQGLMQLMPQTAKMLEVDPTNPVEALHGGAKYLAMLQHRFGDLPTALAAWNWGPGNVAKHGVEALPQETMQFVHKVMQKLRKEEPAQPKQQPFEPISLGEHGSIEDEDEMSEVLLALLDEQDEPQQEDEENYADAA